MYQSPNYWTYVTAPNSLSNFYKNFEFFSTTELIGSCLLTIKNNDLKKLPSLVNSESKLLTSNLSDNFGIFGGEI